ncbi:hypothetical protein FBU30_007466 [Linnemannia zychae]|nr:hypothetical protein FBU30_007466 [Linnemannia zychae]
MSVPNYPNPCITQTAAGDLLLLGVSPVNEGTLNVHKVDISNIASPSAPLFASQNDPQEWTSRSPSVCFPYSGGADSIATFFQFGFLSRFTNIKAEGTIETAIYFPAMGFTSPQTFAFTGSAGKYDYFHIQTNKTFIGTQSNWSALRLNSTRALSSYFSYYTSVFPTGNPGLALGTFTPGGTTGYQIIFDKTGTGTIYSTQLNPELIDTNPTGSLVTLSRTLSVDMNGISLSSSAFGVTSASTAYIFDQATDGSTVTYSINPSQSPKLQALSISGNVPIFSSLKSATAAGSNIIALGVSNVSTVFFNSFDTNAKSWTGPNLMTPAKPPGPSPDNGSNNNNHQQDNNNIPIGAIVGGVVGGLVVIALIAFLFVRNRRNRRKRSGYKPAAINGPTNNYHDQGKFGNGGNPVVNPTQMVQPMTHHHMPQPTPIVPPQAQYYNPALVQQQQQQQQHVYTPPTLIPQEQQHLSTSPVIFQPQPTVTSSPAHTNTVYSPTTTAVSDYQHTPTTPVTSSAYIGTDFHHNQQPVPSVPAIKPQPSNPQYIAPSMSGFTNPPSNPQYIPQAGSEYAQ